MTKHKKSSKKRDRFRKAAYCCFREHGYYGTSIDDICEKASSSKGSFYWHYNAKVDVFVDILESWASEVVVELVEQFEEALQSDAPLHAIEEALRSEFHRARAIVPLWAEFTLHARRDREIQVSMNTFYKRARVAIVDLLYVISRGRLSRTEVESAAAVILGAYMGLTLQDLVDPASTAETWVTQFFPLLSVMLHSLMNIALDKDELGAQSRVGARLDDPQIADFLTFESQTSQATFAALRQRIFEVQPEVDENILMGWGVTAYTWNKLVCQLKPTPKGVALSFYKGDTLLDPDRLLLGSGKHRRTVWVQSPCGIPLGLRALLCQAFASE